MNEADRARFTDTEWAIFQAGECCYQTGYGLPWMTFCHRPSDPDHPLGYCTTHSEEGQ